MGQKIGKVVVKYQGQDYILNVEYNDRKIGSLLDQIFVDYRLPA